MKKIRAEISWVSKKMLKLLISVFVLLILISIFFYKVTVVTIVSSILSVLILLIILCFLYAYYKLSSKGGDIQQQVSSLVINKVDEKSIGKLLDIGCGSGVLSVELAIKCPKLKIWGIDYWGSIWGYSKDKCEKLASDYHVSDRVSFEQASASSLPFDDESFDIIISNMVFHEVADAKDKREVIKEALRVLKEGAQFIFQDLFLSKSIYDTPDKLILYIENLKVTNIYLEKTSELINIPGLLKTSLFFGYAAIVSGDK